MTGAYLVMSTGAGSGTITTARGIQVAPSFAVQPVNARGIDIENMGTISGGLTATGIYIQKQLNSFITEGIYLNGDGIGADIVFGAGRDANIYYDGTDLVIDAALKGTGTLNLISQAANAITTETLNEYVTIKINGVNKKIAIVA